MLRLKGSSGWAELQENTALTVLLLCTMQKTLLRGKAEYTTDSIVCWVSASTTAASFHPCRAVRMAFPNREHHWQQPDSVIATDHSTLSDTDSPPSIQVRRLTWNNLPQALVRHRLAQTCWLHFSHLDWKVSCELRTYTPGSWSGQRQNHAGKRENHAGALQFLVCDCEEVKR